MASDVKGLLEIWSKLHFHRCVYSTWNFRTIKEGEQLKLGLPLCGGRMVTPNWSR